MSPLRSHYASLMPEAGLDEAGRGCLAGPVVAAAVIWPRDAILPELNDSKKCSEARRELLRQQVESLAEAWAVARVEPAEIDEINILQATFTAMHRALDQLSLRPRALLIDGNRFRSYGSIPHHCAVGGDGLYCSVAAASILAKTHRDAIMKELHNEFPQYEWWQNKGYPSRSHREALASKGPCKWHRQSFQLQPLQRRIPFK